MALRDRRSGCARRCHRHAAGRCRARSRHRAARARALPGSGGARCARHRARRDRERAGVISPIHGHDGSSVVVDLADPGTRMRPLSDSTLGNGEPLARETNETGYEWIQVAAHLERLAPQDVTVDQLARAEDAAADRMYQRSLARMLDTLSVNRP